MPAEFSNPNYVNPGGGSGGSVAAVPVANQAERLAIPPLTAASKLVKQLDSKSLWCLKPAGNPAVLADWELLGYYDLGNVNNTSDSAKPVSTAQASAIAAAQAAAAADATTKANTAASAVAIAASTDATTKANAAIVTAAADATAKANTAQANAIAASAATASAAASAAVLAAQSAILRTAAQGPPVSSGGVAQVIRMDFPGVAGLGDYIHLHYEFRLVSGGSYYGDIEVSIDLPYSGSSPSAHNEAQAVYDELFYGGTGGPSISPIFDMEVIGGSLFLTRKEQAANMPAFAMFADIGAETATAATIVNGVAPLPDTLTITGTEYYDGVYSQAADENGKPAFGPNGGKIRWNGSSWVIGPDSAPLLGSYVSTDAVASPELVATWVALGDEVGPPALVRAGATIPDYIGQLCRVGDVAPFTWYRAATLSSWEEDGAATVDPADLAPGDTAPVNGSAGAAATATLTVNSSLTQYEIYIGGRGIAASFSLLNSIFSALSIADAVNADSLMAVTAVASSSVVTLTAKTPGTGGNSITLSVASAGVTASGATLTGGSTVVAATLAPPYLRVAGGKLYVQEAGVWKSATLSPLP